MRLDRYLSLASLGMRKEVQRGIRDGVVTVNGEIVTIPESEICEKEDIICYEGRRIHEIEKRYYMFHKPAGCVTARSDEQKTTVLDYFADENTAGLFPVGRLDKDTEGLLLLTNDGLFDQWLMNPKHHMKKRYYFWAMGSISEEDTRKLETGLSIGEGEKITKPAQLELVKWGQYEEHKEELLQCGMQQIKMNPTNQPVVAGYLTISEGRKHQVKRMLKAVGCYIVYLKRMDIGEVALDQSLEKGQYRPLTEKEVAALME